jgi:ABC-type sugar transport system substrate-binding protein
MSKLAFAALAAMLTAAPVFAADAPASKPKQVDPNKKICHEVPELGSRLTSTRVCHTAAEEDQARQNRRQFVEEAQRGFSRCSVDPSRC